MIGQSRFSGGGIMSGIMGWAGAGGIVTTGTGDCVGAGPGAGTGAVAERSVLAGVPRMLGTVD